MRALGEAISELLKLEIQRSLVPEARSAVCQINEGTKILADLFYRLSLSRRAQISPSLSLLAKNTASNIPPDELLFGDEMKKAAATLEKSDKDLVRASPIVSKKTLQPIMQQLYAAPSTSTAGNFRAPALAKTSATRRIEAPPSFRRTPYCVRSRLRRR